MNLQEKFTTLINQASSTKEKLFYAGLQLFAQKGYANVGIRELCRCVNIKESSFYNHYAGKEILFEAILDYFDQASNQVIMTEVETHAMIEQASLRTFLQENMKRFSAISSNVLYHTALQIVLTESFLHPKAAKIAQNNMYHLRKGYTEEVLTGLMKRGAIRRCDVHAVTAEYYYALKGILDEFLLCQLWNADMTEIEKRIVSHIDFFVQMLSPAQ